MKYIYKAVRVPTNDPSDLDKTLREHGRDGYRLVQVAPVSNDRTPLIFEKTTGPTSSIGRN